MRQHPPKAANGAGFEEKCGAERYSGALSPRRAQGNPRKIPISRKARPVPVMAVARAR